MTPPPPRTLLTIQEPVAYTVSVIYSIIAYTYFLATRGRVFDLLPFYTHWHSSTKVRAMGGRDGGGDGADGAGLGVGRAARAGGQMAGIPNPQPRGAFWGGRR